MNKELIHKLDSSIGQPDIRKVKGSYPPTYILLNKIAFRSLPYFVKHAFHCACGTIYAWRRPSRDVDKDWRPICPTCCDMANGEFIVRTSLAGWHTVKDLKSKDAMGRADGVYVDVSLRNGHMILGFVVVQNEKAKMVSCSAENQKATYAAEREAVILAQHHWPNLTVFCDCAAVCNETGATYIHRKHNDLAHRVARQRINFKGWVTV